MIESYSSVVSALLSILYCLAVYADTPDVKAKIDALEHKAIKALDHSTWLSSISNDSVRMYYMRPAIDGLLCLSEATGNTKYVGYASEYLEYVNRRGNELKNSLRLNSKGAYYWPGYTNGGEEDVYDTSHSGDIVDFMVEAYRAGLVFDKTDIQRLANTVKRNLWNGSLSAPQFQERCICSWARKLRSETLGLSETFQSTKVFERIITNDKPYENKFRDVILTFLHLIGFSSHGEFLSIYIFS